MRDLLSYKENIFPFQSQYHLIDACSKQRNKCCRCCLWVFPLLLLLDDGGGSSGVDGDGDVCGDGGG